MCFWYSRPQTIDAGCVSLQFCTITEGRSSRFLQCKSTIWPPYYLEYVPFKRTWVGQEQLSHTGKLFWHKTLAFHSPSARSTNIRPCHLDWISTVGFSMVWNQIWWIVWYLAQIYVYIYVRVCVCSLIFHLSARLRQDFLIFDIIIYIYRDWLINHYRWLLTSINVY